MNPFNWQDIVVIIAVASAAIYLGVRTVAVFVKRNRAGCGAGCSTCPSSQQNHAAGTSENVISIEQLTATAKPFRPK